MRILLITSVYENEVVGPARFARLLEESSEVAVDVLTSNVKETKTLKSVDIDYKWWQKKLKIYFSIPHFSIKVNTLKDEYDVLLYNSSVLTNPKEVSGPFVVMVNDEKLASLKFNYNFDYWRRLLHRQVEKEGVRKAAKVIVNSNYLKDKISEAYAINPDKVNVLHKGISLVNKRLEFADTLTHKKTINVLFVKNDFILGGLNDLISALRMMYARQFKLTIVGTSNKVKEHLIPLQNVKYNVLGYQSNDAVIKAMYNHDILCIPSRFEPLGVAVMEGLAVGIPTITTGVGGLREVTDNGANVWECKPNNPNSIVRQLEGCLMQPDLRKERSKKGKQFIHDNFDFKDVVKRLKGLLKSNC